MSGRHAAARVVAEPEALAQLEQMLDDAPRTDPKRARALAVAHRRRSIAWDVWANPQMRAKVEVPVPGLTARPCSAPHASRDLVCSRPVRHGGRHAAFSGLAVPGRTSRVLAVWSGGAR